LAIIQLQVNKFLALLILSICSFGLQGQDKVLKREDWRDQRLLFDGIKERDKGNYNEAGKYFQQLINVNSKMPVAHYELGRLLLISGDPIGALPHAQKAVELAPENIHYLQLLADLQTSNQLWEEALVSFDKLIELEPNNPNYYLVKTSALQQLGDQKKAFEVIEELEKKYGTSPQLWMQRVDLVLSDPKLSPKKKLQKAEKICLEGLEVLDNDLNLLGRLGEIYEMQKEPEKAIATLLSIREELPSNGQLSFLLSKLYLEIGQDLKAHEFLLEAFESAQVNFEEKLGILITLFRNSQDNPAITQRSFELIESLKKQHPNEAGSYTISGDFLNREGRLDEAQNAYEKSLSLDPSKHRVWRQLIIVYSIQGNEKAVLEASRKAKDLFPDLSLFYLFEGQALLSSGESKKAAEVLEDGVLLSVYSDMEQAEFYYYLGSAYHETEQHAKSDEAFEKSLMLYPDNAFLLNNYSYYLALRGVHLDKAEEMSRKSNELDPNRSSFCDTFGYILFLNDKVEESLEWFEKAISLGAGGSSEVLGHYASALEKAGKTAEAKEVWKKVLELDPENKDIQEKLK